MLAEKVPIMFELDLIDHQKLVQLKQQTFGKKSKS
jgi:hypothetical protein